MGNAGFHSVAVNALDAPIGGADVDQTLNLSLKMGPLGAVLREHPELATAALCLESGSSAASARALQNAGVFHGQ